MEIPGPERPSMRQLRPAWMTHIIDEAFDDLSVAVPEGWSFHGTRNSYEFGSTSTTVLMNELSQRHGWPLDVLDVGTGAGSLIALNRHHNVHGITAHDYRKLPDFVLPNPPNDDQYIVGNAEHLDTLPGLLPTYNLVVSRWTLQHMVDQLAAIEQMAARVRTGGILAIDSAHFGKHMVPGAIVDAESAFLEAGFMPYPGFTMGLMRHPGMLPLIVLEKTKDAPPLRFGYGYEMDDDGDWYYAPL